jgi:UDP-glucose 4-epimerase
MTLAWVIGRGGLLGSAVGRALEAAGAAQFVPPRRLAWHDQAQLAADMQAAVGAFAARAAGSADVRAWEVYWAAGVGSMGSAAGELEPETRALELLLHCLDAEPRLASLPGRLAFASSAGAIYAASADQVISERSADAPNTAYAREKLRQEALVRAFAQAGPGRGALIARFSTLYGPGQSTGKQQGLISHMARCAIRNQPIRIYVPFDTMRDYIVADDAAAARVLAARGQDHGARMKIIASERPTTIAEIIAAFKRVARRAPRIVTSSSRLSSVYAHRIQFRSQADPGAARIARTTLMVGIAQVMQAERGAFARGTAASSAPR